MNQIKLNLKQKLCNWLVIASMILPAFAFAEDSFSLQKLVESTVTTNPEVQARYHAYLAAVQEQNSAKGGYLPKVDLVGIARTQEKLTPNINNTQTPDAQMQLVLKQMLFDGFATPKEVSRLGHAARVRYFELQSAMQSTSLDTVKAYVDVQRYRQLVGYAKDNYVAHKQLFDRIEERVTAGVARRVDLEQASGRLALAEANLLTESTNLHDVSARYQRLTGELPPANLSEFNFQGQPAPSSVTDSLQVAYQKNPDLLAAIENIVATQDEVEARRGKYYPRLDLQARKNLAVNSSAENSLANADVLELTATFNLFNGFSDKANIAQSVEKLNNAQDLRDKACVDTRQTLVIAYNDILSLKEQLGYRDQHQLSIEKAREAYRKQFDIGQRTLLDLLDTENEYFQARRTYAITDNDLISAYARTFASQGELLSKLGVTRVDLPNLSQDPSMDNYKTCQLSAPEKLEFDKTDLVAKARPLNSGANDKMAAAKPAPAKPAETKIELNKVVPDVQFETNSAKIKKVSYPVLDNAVATVKSWGDVKVLVSGHTDKRDTSKEDYNLDLSTRRAQAVSDYLASKGIDSAKMSVKGYGYSVPIAENDPKEGNQLNRRVEIIKQ